MSVERIRERYAAVTGPRHTCVVANVTREELRAGKPDELGACRYNVIENGVLRGSASCNAAEPTADPDWIEDVGALLAALDRLEALVNSAVDIEFPDRVWMSKDVRGLWEYGRAADSLGSGLLFDKASELAASLAGIAIKPVTTTGQ